MLNINEEKIVSVVALLIHAAKIDDNYKNDEKILIRHFIEKNLTDNKNIDKIFDSAEKLENDSNQILSFTNILKKENEDFKSRIVEELWNVIISDDKVDQYENNLMRRICGLIYFPDRLCGELKLKILNKKK